MGIADAAACSGLCAGEGGHLVGRHTEGEAHSWRTTQDADSQTPQMSVHHSHMLQPVHFQIVHVTLIAVNLIAEIRRDSTFINLTTTQPPDPKEALAFSVRALTAQGKLCVSAVKRMSRSRSTGSRGEGCPGFTGRMGETMPPRMALQRRPVTDGPCLHKQYGLCDSAAAPVTDSCCQPLRKYPCRVLKNEL